MVKITKDGAVLALTERPNWVRVLDNGVYGLCNYDAAEGVAIDGAVYNLSGHAISESGEVEIEEVDLMQYISQAEEAAVEQAVAIITGEVDA